MGCITLNEEQRKLAENNLNLIAYVLRRTTISDYDEWEDAYQTGAIGLMKAAYHFDARRGASFSTFAIPCIVNELKMVRRHAKRHSNPVIVASLQDALPRCEDDTLHLEDMIAADTPELDSDLLYRETCAEVFEVLTHSGDKDALFLFQMMLEKRRQEDIASALGCTQSCVSRRQKRIRELIRQALF